MSRSTILLCGILLIGAVARVWGLTFGLPHTDVRPDETAVVGVAIGLLYAGLNPRFFHWPSFEFYVVAALYRIAWEVGHWRGIYHLKFDMYREAHASPTFYVLVPRVVAAAAGIATIWLVYRFTLRMIDRTTALVAAFFLALAFLHVRDSHFGVTDVPMTFLAMAAMIPLGQAFLDPSGRRRWVSAGILTGLAASTKYNGGVMVAVGLATAAIAVMDAHGAGAPLHVRAALRGLLWFLVAAALAFVAGTPYSVLDSSHFIEGLRFDTTHLMAGHGVLLGRGWIYHLLFSLRYGLGAPLLLAALAGMPVLAARSWRKAVLVCTFPIVYYLLVGRGYTVFARYITPVVPFLCITAAVAVVELVRRIAGRWPGAAPVVTGAAALLLAVPSIQSVLAFDRLVSRPDTRLLAAAWLDARRLPSDWIHEEFPAILHPEFTRPPAIRLVRFDASRNAFINESGEAVTPDWIVLGSSSLTDSRKIEPQIQPLRGGAYTLVATFEATSTPESPQMFDQQDEFFVPFSDFSHRVQMGPDIRIYRRSRPDRIG